MTAPYGNPSYLHHAGGCETSPMAHLTKLLGMSYWTNPSGYETDETRICNTLEPRLQL